jgi:hypothetical protein
MLIARQTSEGEEDTHVPPTSALRPSSKEDPTPHPFRSAGRRRSFGERPGHNLTTIHCINYNCRYHRQ